MSADLPGYAAIFAGAATAVTALIVAIAGLLRVVPGKRPALVAPATTIIYAVSGGTASSTGDLGFHRPMIGAPQGTVTQIPRWVSTHTPLVIIAILLIALFDMTSLRRTPEVGPVSERVAPVIAHAEFIYDGSGNIVFNVAGTYDELGRLTRSSVPTTSTERSDFSWVVDLENVTGSAWGLAMSDLELPVDLTVARLTLRPGDLSTYSIARVGGDVTPVDHRMVYVYAGAFGDDIQSSDKWIKIGEGTLTPSGSWSVVGSVPGDWSRTNTTGMATTKISLAAIVVPPVHASGDEKPDAPITLTTTLTLADLDAMGRSEIVTVVPHRRFQGRQGTDAGDPSRTTPVTGEPPQR